MKNKIFYFILVSLSVVTLASCAGSRSRYGCPSTATTQHAAAEKNI